MKVNYDGMAQIYESLNSIVKDMIDVIDSSHQIVSQLDNNDYWKGASFDSFNKKYADMVTSFKAFCNDVYKVNTKIMDSANRYKNADQKVLNILFGGK